MPKYNDHAREDGERIAALLGETEERPRWSIMLLVRRLGVETVDDLARRAIALHAAEGVPRYNGEPRTLGGVFFWITKKQIKRNRWKKYVGGQKSLVKRMIKQELLPADFPLDYFHPKKPAPAPDPEQPAALAS